MILESLKRLFFESESHTPVMDRLRTCDDITHAEGGMAVLLDADGEVNLVCTVWYARAWVADHPAWSWKPL